MLFHTDGKIGQALRIHQNLVTGITHMIYLLINSGNITVIFNHFGKYLHGGMESKQLCLFSDLGNNLSHHSDFSSGVNKSPHFF